MSYLKEEAQGLRAKILKERKEFDFALYEQANKVICQRVLDFLNSLRLTSLQIGIYWPVVGEVDLLQFFTSFFNKQLALPIVSGQYMIFAQYQSGDPLSMSFKGIYQPTIKTEIVPDIIFIPGLAFSCSGYRLGFGRGYYDRYLHALKSIKRIIAVGICFHDKLFLSLPTTERDYKVNYIITDKILIRL